MFLYLFFLQQFSSNKHHPNLFYLRKVRISAKIFRGIDKMTIFAEEKCGYPQKSFVDYGYREEKIKIMYA